MWLKHALTLPNLGEVRARRPRCQGKLGGFPHTPSGLLLHRMKGLLLGRYSRAVMMMLSHMIGS
jgi:hypothetical protein